MTVPTNTNGANSGPEGMHPTLSRIAAAAGQQGASGEVAAPASGGSNPPETVTIDVGGTQRAVALKDLRESYLGRLDLESREKALQQQLRDSAMTPQMRAMMEAMESLPPQRQAKVLALLQGDDVGDEGGNPSGEELARQARGNREPDADEGGRQPTFDRREYDELRSVVRHLARSHMDGMEQKQQASAGERVDALMSQFPVFRQDPVGSAFAKDYVMSQFAAARGKLDLDAAVTEVAAKAQNLRQQRATAPVDSDPRPALPKNFRPDANALQSGSLARVALDRFRSLQG